MPFTPRTTIDPAEMTTAWSAGVARSGAKWAKKTLNPRRMFNHDPAKAAHNWQAGVSGAAPNYQAGLAGTDLNHMEASINGPGQTRYAQAGTQKVANFQKKSGALANLIQAAMAATAGMDTSTPQARIAKSTAFQTYMHDHAASVPGGR